MKNDNLFWILWFCLLAVGHILITSLLPSELRNSSSLYLLIGLCILPFIDWIVKEVRRDPTKETGGILLNPPWYFKLTYSLYVFILLAVTIAGWVTIYLANNYMRRFLFHIPESDILIDYQVIALGGPILVGFFGGLTLGYIVVTCLSYFLPKNIKEYFEFKATAGFHISKYDDKTFKREMEEYIVAHQKDAQEFNTKMSRVFAKVLMVILIGCAFLNWGVVTSYIRFSDNSLSIRQAYGQKETIIDLKAHEPKLEEVGVQQIKERTSTQN